MVSDIVKYISLADAAEGTSYSQEYLSLLARKGKLHSQKIGRNWYTTREAVRDYTARQKELLVRELEANSQTQKITDEKISMPSTPSADMVSDRHIKDKKWRSELWNGMAVVIITLMFFTLGVIAMNFAQNPDTALEKSGRDLQSFLVGAGEQVKIPAGLQENARAFAGLFGAIANRITDAIYENIFGVSRRIVKEEIQPIELKLDLRSSEVEPHQGFQPPEISEVRRVTEVVERKETFVPADLAVVKNEILTDVEEANRSFRAQFENALNNLTLKLSRTTSSAESNTRIITLTQKIDTLGEATLSNITFSGTGNSFNLKDSDIPDDITVTGTINPSSLTVQKTLTVSGTGTSTYSGGIQATVLDITSTTATSTFANGIQLSAGCFRDSTGSCVGTGGGTINTGTTNRLAYYSAATTLDSVSFLTADTSNLRLGIGTTSPGAALSVMGTTTLSGGLTIYATTTLLSLTATSTATSTFTGGISAGGLSSSQGFTLTGGSLIYPSANFILTSSGSLGAGTTTPGSLLSIQGGNLQVTGTSTANGLIATSTLFVGSNGNLFNVLQSGLVGIGTTTPGSLLSVHGGNLQVTGTSTASSLIATSTLFVGTQGQFFNVLQSGLVGIGTTSPGSLLSIHGGNAQITGTSTASAIIATSTLFVGSTGNLFNVLQSGLVGIATTSPSSLLSIHGNTLISATTTTGSLIATSTLYVGSSGQRLLINESGNIGIGTTSPGSLFSIQGISNFVSAATSTLYTTLSLPSIYSTSTIATSTFAGSLYVASSTPTQNALFAVGTSSPLLFVNRDSGNVGIGTTSPSVLFSVAGAGYFTSNVGIGVVSGGSPLDVKTSSINSGLRLLNSDDDVLMVASFQRTNGGTTLGVARNGMQTVLAIPNSIFAVGTENATDFVLGTNNAERARITSAGNVGIGTTSPATLLSVQGADVAGTKYMMIGAGTRAAVFWVASGDAAPNGTVVLSVGQTSGSSALFGGDTAVTTGALCVDDDGTGCPSTPTDGRLYSINATVLTDDLAEYMRSSQNLEPGDIVIPDPDFKNDISRDYEQERRSKELGTKKGLDEIGVKRSTKKYQQNVIGIVSTKPGITLGGFEPTEKDYEIALTGRVPLKVSTESGSIKIGDRITSSSLAGVGMKATKDGYTVGIALEGFDGENSTTTAKIHPTPPLLKEGDEQGSSSIPRPMAGMAAEGLATSSETKIVKTGKILVFVNLGYSKLDDEILRSAQNDGTGVNAWTIDQTTGRLTTAFTGGLNLQGNSIENVSKILSANGRWSIDEDGFLSVKKVSTEEFEVGSEEKPSGITIYDTATKQPKCVRVENDVVQVQPGKCN